MNKKIFSLLIFFFLTYFSYSFSYEKEEYLTNIEKAFDFFDLEGSCETAGIDHLPLREDLKKLLLNLFEKEQQYPDYIHCVTAQDSLFYAYQVIAKELYLKIYGPSRMNFEFLRFPTEDLLKNRKEFFERYPSLIISFDELVEAYQTSPHGLADAIRTFEDKDELDYIKIYLEGEKEGYDDVEEEEEQEDEEAKDRSKINDTLPEISRQLISVNFTMETCRPLDSAMFALLSGRSISVSSMNSNKSEYLDKFSNILKELFESLSIPKEKAAPCIKKLLKKAPSSRVVGIVNQIFLPRDHLSDFLYISLAGGFLDPFYDSTLEASYDDFQRERMNGNFRIARNFQARIIAGSLVHNEKVKIFRYTLIPEEEQQQYQIFVKKMIHNLFRADSN